VKQKQGENVTMLKQKLIYYQSELSRYKAKLQQYEQSDMMSLIKENEYLKRELESLTKRLHEATAENVLLKELAFQSEERYKQLQQVRKEKDELEKRLAERKKQIEEETNLDSWFIHTLKQQNAIVSPSAKTNPKHHSISSPFSFSEEEK
jgi:chromosome segregation ATPase